MYCGKCGKDVGNAAFCPYCGTRIENEKSNGQSKNEVEKQPVKKAKDGILKKRSDYFTPRDPGLSFAQTH